MKAVYIPLIASEVDDLQFLSYCWRVKRPFLEHRTENTPWDLLISFDKKHRNIDEALCTELFKGLGFRKVTVICADLDDKEAIYIRSVAEWKNKPIPKFGLKSGPNLHFLFNQKTSIDLGYQQVFQCETDVIPVKSGWLDILASSIDESDLISGAIYRGPSHFGQGRLMFHINGNAIYVLSNPGYSHWLEFIETSILFKIRNGKNGVAFDTAPFDVLHEIASMGKQNDLASFEAFGFTSQDAVRKAIQAIDYNRNIHNFSGWVETSPSYILDFEAILSEYGDNPVLVHSSAFRYFALTYLLTAKFSLEEKKWLATYIQRRLFPLDQRKVLQRRVLSNNDALRDCLADSYISPRIWS